MVELGRLRGFKKSFEGAEKQDIGFLCRCWAPFDETLKNDSSIL